MTTSTTMDIDTFCALPRHIENVVDKDGNEWFVLDHQLQELLALPVEFDHNERINLEDRCSDLVEREGGAREEVDLVSEASLYMLMLTSRANAVRTLNSWVLDVVAPTLAADGEYQMGEERTVPAPCGYKLWHVDIWSGDLDDPGDAMQLAMRFLPDLRETGMTDCGVIRVIDGKAKNRPERVRPRYGQEDDPEGFGGKDLTTGKP